MCKVTHIIPVYNGGKLVRTLGCMFNQTERDRELIVVDDGSTNGCIERLPMRKKSILGAISSTSGLSCVMVGRWLR